MIPGTHEPDYVEKPIRQHALPVGWSSKMEGRRSIKVYGMGTCTLILSRDQAGIAGEWLWHLSISCPDRHPTWDEIKTARYRLLPSDLCFGMLLPPPEFYVNVEAQDHVFHLWEITDPREPWSSG